MTCRAVVALALALVACGPKPRTERTTAMCPPNDTDTGDDPSAHEIDMYYAVALNPLGDPQDVADREQATCWLLEHADTTYPIVAKRAAASGEAAAVALLARFDRPASTPILSRVLHAATGAQLEAAFGLARLARASDAAAREALLSAVAADKPETVVAALDGLRVLGDATTCDTVSPRTGDKDATIRYAAVHAGAVLGCLDRARLKVFARDDADADVRALASRLARGRR